MEPAMESGSGAANGSASATGLRLRPARIAGFLLGFAVVAAAAEIGLRAAPPAATTNVVSERTLDVGNPLHPNRGLFELDDTLGFRPVPGCGKYDLRGVLHNEYSLEKDSARERVLFLGDSIVERGTLLDAIRRVWGEERFEWWNAGVTAYSTVQEVGYYRECLEGIEADHLVLVFSLNDFEDTPLVTLDGDGKLLILNAHRSGLNPWLMQHSHLYRYWAGKALAAPAIGRVDESLIEVVEEQLTELRALTGERGTTLTVIVVPPMRPLEMWTPLVEKIYARTIEMLEEQGISHHAVLEQIGETVLAGEELGEPAGDFLHPSPVLCDRIATMLDREGFLGGAR
jgi:hypothetical protein